MVSIGNPNYTSQNEVVVAQSKEEGKRRLSKRNYGSISGEILGENCPTCQGVGRIPRGCENQLVAVIPCSDQRLKPSRTVQYVCVSVSLCLLVCFLVLFFLFPRSVTMVPVAIQSVRVYFTPNTVEMTVTNIFNITNDNFATIQTKDLDLQVLIFNTVVGRVKMSNVSSVQSRSHKVYTFALPITIENEDLNFFCKSETIRIHTVLLHLQITMTVLYLGHPEQLSIDTFEYVDCGTNTTAPHSI